MNSTDTRETYKTLLRSAEKTWKIWGPNSGGGESWFFAQGQIWYHRYGPDHGNGFFRPMEPQEFIDRHWPQRVGRGRRHGRIIRWLVAQGHGCLPAEDAD
jgi:hypothetical protein